MSAQKKAIVCARRLSDVPELALDPSIIVLNQFTKWIIVLLIKYRQIREKPLI